MIHKSHSKKDLYDLITAFHFPILPGVTTKELLLKSIMEALDSNLFMIPTNNKYLIEDKDELLLYLISVNPKKMLSVKDKKELIINCKRITHYCRNNYDLYKTEFKNTSEINNLVKECSLYGDIPSVRKMIRLYNLNPLVTGNIQPIISKIMKKELEDKKSLKYVSLYNLIITPGPHLISFD